MACQYPNTANNASEMFGLGVRIGYYIQWYALILEERFLPPEMQVIRISLLTFVAAAALSVLVQLPKLDPVVTYITLLLTFGYWYHLIFIAAWGIIAQTRKDWRKRWNASIFPGYLQPHAIVEGLWLILLIGVLAFLVYFWAEEVPTLNDIHSYCGQRYGFFFAKIRLNNQTFRIFNLVISTTLLAALAVQAFFRLVPVKQTFWDHISLGSVRRRSAEKHHPRWLNLKAFSQIIISTIILVATELCIRWNGFDVNSLAGTGQLIPVFLATVTFLRVLFLMAMKYMTPEGLNNVRNWVPRLL